MIKSVIIFIVIFHILYSVKAQTGITSTDLKYPGYLKTETGLFYKMITKNDSAPLPEIGDIICITMVYKTNRDSVLFDSYTDPRVTNQLLRLPLEKPLYKGDFAEGLAMMHIGDSASFITSTDSFFYKYANLRELPSIVKAGTFLCFTIKLCDFMKKADYEKQQERIKETQSKMNEKWKKEEPDKIKKFIDSNKIKTKPTASGLYYIQIKKGKGEKVTSGDLVAIQFTGKFLDGRIFNSSIDKTPLLFVAGSGDVIKGIEEGILNMRAGAKAILIIPSSLGYMDKGAGDYLIPPYTPLIFEIEVMDVVKVPKKK